MDFLFKGTNEETSDCPFDMKDIQRCPFLRNINKPTCFSFSSVNLPLPVGCLFAYHIPFASILVVGSFYLYLGVLLILFNIRKLILSFCLFDRREPKVQYLKMVLVLIQHLSSFTGRTGLSRCPRDLMFMMIFQILSLHRFLTL